MNTLGVNIADVWYDIFPVRNGKNRLYNELSVKLLDRVISFSSNESDLILDPFGGFRVIIMTQANSQVNTRLLELLPKLKTKKLSGWCAV